jgi:hypothetical protein
MAERGEACAPGRGARVRSAAPRARAAPACTARPPPLALLLLLAAAPPLLAAPPAARAVPSPMCLAAAPCRLKCSAACDELARPSGRRVAVPGLGATPLHLFGSSPPPPDASAGGPEPMAALIARAAAAAEAKAEATAAALRPDQYPMATLPGGDGGWETVRPGHWMSGLFPGVMWQLYELGGRTKPVWVARAAKWQAALADRQRDFGAQHDFGGPRGAGVEVGVGPQWVGGKVRTHAAAAGGTATLSNVPKGVAWPLRGLRKDHPTLARPSNPLSPSPPHKPLGFIYLPSFAHSYSVTNSTEDLRQALAAAEVGFWGGAWEAEARLHSRSGACARQWVQRRWAGSAGCLQVPSARAPLPRPRARPPAPPPSPSPPPPAAAARSRCRGRSCLAAGASAPSTAGARPSRRTCTSRS